MSAPAPHVLVFEAQTEGHHLSWLRYITEDLLAAGARLTLALDRRLAAQERINEQLSDLLPRVDVIPARSQKGWIHGGGHADTVAFCQLQCGADHVFMACLDEIASHTLRRAALGMMPPQSLRGKLGGIYIRPKFLAKPPRTPNDILKSRGFNRLLKENWFRQILLLDEHLTASLRTSHPGAPFHFLPDTCPEPEPVSRQTARAKWGIPAEACVFLFYGGAYKRKGLDLAVAAFDALKTSPNAVLLCVGERPREPALARKLEDLRAAGRAFAVNRYVSLAEENLAFAAADWVLLPYRGHFGSSGVLIRAAIRGIPVIASDEELVGRRVREHGIGLLFPTGSAKELQRSIENAAIMKPGEVRQLSTAAIKFSKVFTRAEFRNALLKTLN
jgi:glycosyltransferase involved in cell wall biosynthesis